MSLGSLVALSLLAALSQAIPSPPLYFENRCDHFSITPCTYSQRYYTNASSFGGAGSPIIVIMGGEGAIAPTTGIFYPSVVVLAERLHALIIEPEHRGYGESQPTPFDTHGMSLITAPQALADAVALILATQEANNCTGRVGSGPRCPVLTVGGSYPGWLSAMMRLRYPAVVDMAYAGSAPMGFYSQQVDQYAYYARVTESAARASAGCPDAVRGMLAGSIVGASKADMVSGLNLCTPLPDYLAAGDATLLAQELAMVVMYTFAGQWERGG